MSENIDWKTLLRRVLIQLWDKWPKCFSDQNLSAKKKTSREVQYAYRYCNIKCDLILIYMFQAVLLSAQDGTTCMEI